MEEQGLEYWLRWQVPVCALIIILPAFFSFRFIQKSKPQFSIQTDLWSPSWKKLNPIWLLLYRALAFACLVQLLYNVVALNGGFVFYFYTQWTFTLVVLYFALGTVVSAYGLWARSKGTQSENERINLIKRDDLKEDGMTSTPTPDTNEEENEIKATPKLQSHQHADEDGQVIEGILSNLLQITYLTCAGAVILTDIVFWCLLVPFLTSDSFRVDFIMAAMHSFNAVFLILDTILNRLPFSWFGFAYFVLLSCIYVVFQWILHACGYTWWPYPFLELNTPWAPLWYIGLALVHIPCYGLYVLIVEAKNALLPRFFPHSFSPV